jgi:hypothetical protein
MRFDSEVDCVEQVGEEQTIGLISKIVRNEEYKGCKEQPSEEEYQVVCQFSP